MVEIHDLWSSRIAVLFRDKLVFQLGDESSINFWLERRVRLKDLFSKLFFVFLLKNQSQ